MIKKLLKIGFVYITHRPFLLRAVHCSVSLIPTDLARYPGHLVVPLPTFRALPGPMAQGATRLAAHVHPLHSIAENSRKLELT